MATIVFVLGLAVAVIVVVFHFGVPGNAISPYVIPRCLPTGAHAKSLLRKAGISWIIFSAWLATLTLALVAQLPRQALEGHPVFMGLVAFVIPVTAVMLQIVGWYYLAIGIFSRAPEARPGLRSTLEIEPDQVHRDIRRLTRIATINISALLFALIVPAIEALTRVEPTGMVILPNVAALITFILTLGRIRYYVVRTAYAMMSAEEQETLTRIVNRRSIWLAWYDAYELRKCYDRFKLRPQGRSAHEVVCGPVLDRESVRP